MCWYLSLYFFLTKLLTLCIFFFCLYFKMSVKLFSFHFRWSNAVYTKPFRERACMFSTAMIYVIYAQRVTLAGTMQTSAPLFPLPTSGSRDRSEGKRLLAPNGFARPDQAGACAHVGGRGPLSVGGDVWVSGARTDGRKRQEDRQTRQQKSAASTFLFFCLFLRKGFRCRTSTQGMERVWKWFYFILSRFHSFSTSVYLFITVSNSL